jgi:hypothetical protein
MSEAREVMSVAEEIPDWVPAPVRNIASFTLRANRNKEPLGSRLLVDARMRKVWTELQKHEVKSSTVGSFDKLERLHTWGIDERGFSNNEIACAAFFFRITTELCAALPEKIPTRTQFDSAGRAWSDAADLCRHCQEENTLIRVDGELKGALALVEDYFRREGELRSGKATPYVVVRSAKKRNEDQLRIAVNRIGTATKSIFGDHLYGTVATIAIVAFDLKRKLSESNLERWCKAGASR